MKAAVGILSMELIGQEQAMESDQYNPQATVWCAHLVLAISTLQEMEGLAVAALAKEGPQIYLPKDPTAGMNRADRRRHGKDMAKLITNAGR